MLTNAHLAGARLGAKFWLSRFLVRLRSLEDYRRRMQAEDPLIEMADNHSFAYKFLLLQYQDASPPAQHWWFAGAGDGLAGIES
jgi:hypothetical protein